jgi:hypothetical protein
MWVLSLRTIWSANCSLSRATMTPDAMNPVCRWKQARSIGPKGPSTLHEPPPFSSFDSSHQSSTQYRSLDAPRGHQVLRSWALPRHGCPDPLNYGGCARRPAAGAPRHCLQLADLAARSGSPDTLRRLLGRARAARLISHEMFERLDDVRAVGSRAAHGQIVSPEAARTVLLTARDLVQRLQAWEDDDSLVVGNRPPGLHVCGMAAISRSTSSFVRYSTDEPPEAA